MRFFCVIFVVITVQATCFGAVLPKAGCAIAVNQHFSDPQPLLLLQNGATTDGEAFALPEDDDTVVFETDEAVDIACPSGAVVVDGQSTGKVVVEATCRSGITFNVQGTVVPFTAITCSKVPTHTARYTGNSCATSHREIEIGFKVEDRFIAHIITCFDDDLQHVLYAQSTISASIGGSQVNYPRPSFQVGSFYNVKPDSVSTLYTQNGQRKTINSILSLDESDTSVIQPNSNFYLATGHYIAKADFVYGAQQRLTFYYVNAAPQWQTFNGGNWNTMEANCRSLASSRGLDLVVYTGSYGVTTLDDADGEQQELYLWANDNKRGIPVPAIFYKIVYEPLSKAGIALIGVNNPYKKDVSEEIICNDVCDKVNWLTWKAQNLTLGYGYCCEVNDFREVVTDLPAFEVKSLLT